MPQQYVDTAVAAAQWPVPAQPVPQPSNPTVGDGVVQPAQPVPVPQQSNPPVGKEVVQPAQPVPVGDGVVEPQQSNPPVGSKVVQPAQPVPLSTKAREASFTMPLWLTSSGPWSSVDHAVADINRQWALCDDGVGVLHKGSQQNYLTKDFVQIQRKNLYCYQKTKTECKFRITLESRGVASSWDIVGVGPDCNHPNPKTASQKNAFSSHRGLPDDLRLIGLQLRSDGAVTSFVFKNLVSLYRAKYSEDAPFSYQDVYHSINPHGFQQALDATGFIQHLQHNKDEEGLDFSYVNNEEGVLYLCFNVFKDAVKLFSDGCRPVLFDTKHGTNRYGLRLGCFTTVGRDGGTVLLATAMMAHENQESFEWAFLQFKKFFGAQPHCMFTDGDKAMAAAMKSTLPDTKHFLCIWHLSQTIIKNAKGNILFVYVRVMFSELYNFFKTIVVQLYRILILPQGWFTGAKSGKAFMQFYGAWWELCKNSDVHFQQAFESEWAKLLNLVPEKNRDSPWLRDYIYATHTKWCFAWTWSSVTLGVHSTQRCESIHSVIRMLLSNHSTLVEVIEKLEEWVRTKKMQAQTGLYMDCVKFSTGNTLRQNRLISCMNKTFHDHAIKIATANMHRSLECAVHDAINLQNVPTGMYSVRSAQDISSIQKDFFGPVQWVDNFLQRNPDYDEAITADINRLDRAVSVHDFFPLFRNVYLSDGESCSCQYPQMQGLPCEHCFAVLVIKKQATVMPDIFLKNTFWHIESDETESQFQLWCKQMLMMREATPQPKLPVSTPRSRYIGLMLTAKTMVSGYSLTVTDTDWLEEQMVQMCLGLKDRHTTTQDTLTSAAAKSSGRKCTACGLTGHRNDNARMCAKHKDYQASAVSFTSNILQIGSLAPAQVTGAPPAPVVQLGLEDAQIGSLAPTQVTGAPPALVVQLQDAQNGLIPPAQDTGAPPAAPNFGSPASLDQMVESYDEFDARLKVSNLYPRPVPGDGACFWSACLFGMQWLAKRNTVWCKATQIPSTALEMRNDVLNFMHSNLKTNWAEKGLNGMTTFEDAINQEIPFGVLSGLTDETCYPTCTEAWFTVMRKEDSYTSLCCVQATALRFRLFLKVFIQGSNAVEQYVTQDTLLQLPGLSHFVDPDVCVCLCKRDRGGHFDACEWVAPKVYAHNPATKKGRGKAKQNRHKSAIERPKKTVKKAKQ
jgi:hypothetical protein